MPQPTLEQRVSALEDAVAVLVAGAGGQRKNWKSTVGMFEGDAVIAEIQEEGCWSRRKREPLSRAVAPAASDRRNVALSREYSSSSGTRTFNLQICGPLFAAKLAPKFAASDRKDAKSERPNG
jgi:hypothetical protein